MINCEVCDEVFFMMLCVLCVYCGVDGVGGDWIC